MEIVNIINLIDTKLFEISCMFPVTLGSGSNKELSAECSNFQALLSQLKTSTDNINNIVSKKSKKPIDINKKK